MNDHEMVKKGISILLSIETPVSEIMELYEDHIKACKECSALLEQGKVDFKMIDEPDETLLRNARLQLREKLYGIKFKAEKTFLNYLLNFLRNPVFKYAFMPAVTLIIGLFIGKTVYEIPEIRVLDIPMKSQNVMEEGDFRIKNLLVSFDPTVSQVDLNFELAKEMSIKGGSDSYEVMNFLLYALKNPVSVGTKLKCLDLLSDRKNPEVKESLMFASEYDRNPGVRLAAVKSLKKFELDEDLVRSYLEILRKEKNPAVKVEVLDALKNSDQELVIAFLEENLPKEKNRYLQYKIKKILEKQNKNEDNRDF